MLKFSGFANLTSCLERLESDTGSTGKKKEPTSPRQRETRPEINETNKP